MTQPALGFPTTFDANQPEQLQKQAGHFEFQYRDKTIKAAKNNGTYQPASLQINTADLHPCFLHMQKSRFSHDWAQITMIAPCNRKTSLIVSKPVFGVSDQVRHKPVCTTTEDG